MPTATSAPPYNGVQQGPNRTPKPASHNPRARRSNASHDTIRGQAMRTQCISSAASESAAVEDTFWRTESRAFSSSSSTNARISPEIYRAPHGSSDSLMKAFTDPGKGGQISCRTASSGFCQVRVASKRTAPGVRVGIHPAGSSESRASFGGVVTCKALSGRPAPRPARTPVPLLPRRGFCG